MPARTFSSVDLPVPLPPTSPMCSRAVISQSTFSKRSLWPKRFPAPESWIMQLLSYQEETTAKSCAPFFVTIQVIADKIRRYLFPEEIMIQSVKNLSPDQKAAV